MKRIQLFMLFLLACSTLTFAQISVGAKAGIYTSFVDATDLSQGLSENMDGLTTPSFGLVAEVAFSNNFAIQPELLYTTKGFKTSQGTGFNLGGFPIGANVTARTKINYLEIPLLGKYKFGVDGWRFNVTAGPVFSYAANGELETRANIGVSLNPVKTNIDLDALNYERFEISAGIGAGIAYEMNRGQFFADARYVHGFSDLYKAPVVDLNLKNRGVGITVGYMRSF